MTESKAKEIYTNLINIWADQKGLKVDSVIIRRTNEETNKSA